MNVRVYKCERVKEFVPSTSAGPQPECRDKLLHIFFFFFSVGLRWLCFWLLALRTGGGKEGRGQVTDHEDRLLERELVHAALDDAALERDDARHLDRAAEGHLWVRASVTSVLHASASASEGWGRGV